MIIGVSEGVRMERRVLSRDCMIEDRNVEAVRSAAGTETAVQKLGAPKAHSHSGRAQEGNYTPPKKPSSAVWCFY